MRRFFPFFRRFFRPLDEISKDSECILHLTVRASALCILISLVMSRNLWFQDHRLFMRPLFAWVGGFPGGLDVSLYAILFLSCIILVLAPEYRRIGFLLVKRAAKPV